MSKSLSRFNHWRRADDRVDVVSAPKTVHEAMEKRDEGKAFSSMDCSADPCSCTGCSDWD